MSLGPFSLFALPPSHYLPTVLLFFIFHSPIVPFGLVAALLLSHRFAVVPIPTPRAVAHGSEYLYEHGLHPEKKNLMVSR